MNKVFQSAGRFTLLTAICAMLSVSVFASGTEAASAGACPLPIIYGVVAFFSLLLLLAYCLILRRKERWFLGLFVAVFVTNLGYFVMSLSRTLEMAMQANRMAYLGSVCLPLCMLMIIMGVCELKPRKAVTVGLMGISALVFLLAASGGYLPLYYKEVTMEIVGGAAKLHKVYGPLHPVYLVYLLCYLLAMIGVIVYSALKKKGRLRKYAPVLCTVTLLNMAIWFVEQQIRWDFELLSVSYMVSELLLLFLYDILQERPGELTEESLRSRYPSLTGRELDVLKLILENKKRKEIAEALFITENTVKKHTAHIYEKLEVSDRSELLLKLK